jgi:PAS domain-containing protein
MQGRHKRVLAFHGMRKDVPASETYERVFQAILGEGLDRQLDYYAEYIDVGRFPEPDYQSALREFFRRKYEGEKFDLIVALDDTAHEFVARSAAELFPGTPVVFQASEEVRPDSDFTGVQYGMDFKGTLVIALQLLPEVRQVFVVSGSSDYDSFYLTLARRQFQEFEGRLAFTYLIGLPLKDLQKTLAKLPTDSIIYYLTVVEDRAGIRFRPPDFLDQISTVASVPVFSWYEGFLDRGIVGGNLISAEMVARNTAELALRVLRGESPRSIPITRIATNINLFDWRQLRRWRISEDRLPPGSTIRFREPTVWAQHKWRIIGIIALCGVEALLIVGLLVQRARRRRVEEALSANQERLTLAQEAGRVGTFDWDFREGVEPEPAEMNASAPADAARVTGDWFKRIHPDDRPVVESAIERARTTGDFTSEWRVSRPDGSVQWLHARGKPVYDPLGNPRGLIGVSVDITERKLAEEGLRKAQTELAHATRVVTMGELVSSIAHEVNQPLAAISTYGNACLRFLSGDTPNLKKSRQYIKKFLATIPEYPFQEGSSRNAAGINYNTLKAGAALKRLHALETVALPGS